MRKRKKCISQHNLGQAFQLAQRNQSHLNWSEYTVLEAFFCISCSNKQLAQAGWCKIVLQMTQQSHTSAANYSDLWCIIEYYWVHNWILLGAVDQQKCWPTSGDRDTALIDCSLTIQAVAAVSEFTKCTYGWHTWTSYTVQTMYILLYCCYTGQVRVHRCILWVWSLKYVPLAEGVGHF